MGAQVNVRETGATGGEVHGSIEVRHVPELHACEVAAEDIASLVDEVPVLALVAATAQGTTVFHQVGELRVKESDRLAAIVEGLGLLGVSAWTEGDDLHVQGVPGLLCAQREHTKGPLEFDSLGDHRLAMTWSLVGLCGERPVLVRDFDSIRISYPGFLSDMQRLAQ